MKHQDIPPRERILSAAGKLFHRNGYNTTGINQIIEAAQVAKASLYQHFRSKEDLCIAYLNGRHQYWFEALQTFSNKASSPEHKILASFDFIMHMNEQESYRGCSFLNIVSEISADNAPIMSIIQGHKQDLQVFFTDLLPAGKTSVALHIYFLFESALIESQLFRSQQPVRQIRTIVETLLSQ